MIVIELRGGLGNQMFQYAASYAHALNHATSLYLDPSHISKDPHRHYALDCFTIHNSISPKLLRILSPLFLVSGITSYRETDPTYAEIPSPNVVQILSGYFQSYKYFHDVEQEIRSEFQFKKKLSSDVLLWKQRIESSHAVSIHIRRGDYVSNPKFNKIHGVLDLEYYNNAMSWITSKVNNPTFFIFTDDPIWVKKHWSFENSYVVQHNGEAHDDLHLMSLCKHHILANSSFSWWGAWLDSSNQKIVVAPKRWYASGQSTKDLLPSDWIQI